MLAIEECIRNLQNDIRSKVETVLSDFGISSQSSILNSSQHQAVLQQNLIKNFNNNSNNNESSAIEFDDNDSVCTAEHYENRPSRPSFAPFISMLPRNSVTPNQNLPDLESKNDDFDPNQVSLAEQEVIARFSVALMDKLNTREIEVLQRISTNPKKNQKINFGSFIPSQEALFDSEDDFDEKEMEEKEMEEKEQNMKSYEGKNIENQMENNQQESEEKQENNTSKSSSTDQCVLM